MQMDALGPALTVATVVLVLLLVLGAEVAGTWLWDRAKVLYYRKCEHDKVQERVEYVPGLCSFVVLQRTHLRCSICGKRLNTVLSCVLDVSTPDKANLYAQVFRMAVERFPEINEMAAPDALSVAAVAGLYAERGAWDAAEAFMELKHEQVQILRARKAGEL